MNRVFHCERLAFLTLVVIAGSGWSTGAQNEIKSLPLDPEAYEEIIQARGKVPDPERLQRLIAQYRGEGQIDRVETTEIRGERVTWVSQAPEKFASARRVDGLRLEALRSIDPARLGPEARLDWRTLKERVEMDASEPFDRQLVFPLLHRVAPPFGNFNDPPRTASDYADRLAWLRGVRVALEEIRERLRRGIAVGITAARDDVVSQMKSVRGAVPTDPFESPYLEPFKSFPPSISSADQKRLLAEAIEVYRSSILSAYAEHIRFLEETYLPATRASASLSTLPNGRAHYAHFIRRFTGLEIDPAAVHHAAIAETRRLHVQLGKLAHESGFGSGADFIAAARKDPKCGILDATAAKEKFYRLMQGVERALPRLFTTIPKTPYELEAAPDLPFAFGDAVVVRGSLKESKPGRVRIKTPVANGCSFVHVMLHEAIPGHLFQYHVATESDRISPFRRDLGGSLAYAEGWAQYASGLAGELGLDVPLYERAERIAGEIFMAARAAVETGIHWHGWTQDRAAAYYRETAPWARPDVASAVVQTALSSPGRQSAYMIGHQKMLTLRAYATKELGSRFNIRKFHDQVLLQGPMPLSVLEEQIRDWVVSEKAQH
jgi:uncharacterized protein (DUF885 family)